MNKSGENQDDIAVRRNSQKELPPVYLKLIADCWEHIFDHLSIKDIFMMGNTCKYMNQILGHYIHARHPELEFVLSERNIQLYPLSIILRENFYKFITHMWIYKDDQSNIDFFQGVNIFDSLKKLTFMKFQFTETQIGCMRNVLENIETIKLELCVVNRNTFEQFAIHCRKLKYLNIQGCRNVNGAFNKFFSLNFPMLECLKFRLCSDDTNVQIDELTTFLVQHNNLKSFDMDFRFLWINRQSFNQTNKRLDLLGVHFGTSDDMRAFNQLVNFVKPLYAHGFYKTLKLTFIRMIKNIHREHIYNIIPELAPALKTLFISDGSCVDLTRLIYLKELAIKSFAGSVETVAKSLSNLKRLDILLANVNDIILFIRYSRNLNTIKILSLTENYLDAFTLNQERKKFGNERQVTIYLQEKNYLPTKYMSRNSNLDLIKIKRLDSLEFFVYQNW